LLPGIPLTWWAWQNIFSWYFGFISYTCISLCIVPPVAPKVALEVLNGTATDDSVTRVLAHIGTQVVISCKMTEAYTGGGLRVNWTTSSGHANVTRKSITEVLLVIDDINRDDEGQYLCHAINNIDSALRSLTLVVGSVPEPYEITVTSANGTLTVVWVEKTPKPYDENISAHYVQYRPINGSATDTVVTRFAASVQTTTFSNLQHDVLLAVSMWSENMFGNSSADNEKFIVITGVTGMYG